MTATPVGTPTTGALSGSGSTATTLPQTPTAGNKLLLAVTAQRTTTTAPTITTPTGWTLLGTFGGNNGTQASLAALYYLDSAGGESAPTITVSANGTRWIIAEVSGLASGTDTSSTGVTATTSLGTLNDSITPASAAWVAVVAGGRGSSPTTFSVSTTTGAASTVSAATSTTSALLGLWAIAPSPNNGTAVTDTLTYSGVASGPFVGLRAFSFLLAASTVSGTGTWTSSSTWSAAAASLLGATLSWTSASTWAAVGSYTATGSWTSASTWSATASRSQPTSASLFGWTSGSTWAADATAAIPDTAAWASATTWAASATGVTPGVASWTSATTWTATAVTSAPVLVGWASASVWTAAVSLAIPGVAVWASATTWDASATRAVPGTAAWLSASVWGAGAVVAFSRDITITLTVGTDRWTITTGTDRWATHDGADRWTASGSADRWTARNDTDRWSLTTTGAT